MKNLSRLKKMRASFASSAVIAGISRLDRSACCRPLDDYLYRLLYSCGQIIHHRISCHAFMNLYNQLYTFRASPLINGKRPSFLIES